MHTAEGTLGAVEPFDFQKSVEFVQGFGPMVGEQKAGDGTITKALIVDGRVVVFRARARAQTPGIDYKLYAEEKIDEETNRKTGERISFFLSLGDDVKKFYAIAEKDTPYYPKVRQLWGLHHLKFPSLLEIACWAIINQRIQRSVALRMKKSLTEKYGASFEVEGVKYWAFPDEQRLKAAKPRELVELLKNQRTALRISSLTDSFEYLDQDTLMRLPYQKAFERLKKIKGVGDWSAQFILFRGLGRIEKQRYSMKPVIRMMEEVYGPGETLDDINRRYGEWCGYWSTYLWASSMAAHRDED